MLTLVCVQCQDLRCIVEVNHALSYRIVTERQNFSMVHFAKPIIDLSIYFGSTGILNTRYGRRLVSGENCLDYRSLLNYI